MTSRISRAGYLSTIRPDQTLVTESAIFWGKQGHLGSRGDMREGSVKVVDDFKHPDDSDARLSILQRLCSRGSRSRTLVLGLWCNLIYVLYRAMCNDIGGCEAS